MLRFDKAIYTIYIYIYILYIYIYIYIYHFTIVSILYFYCYITNIVIYYYVILFSLGGDISSPVRYLCPSILPDDNTNLFAASLLVSYYSFPSLILSSTIMISLYIPSKRFSLKCKELSDARVI